MLAAQRHVPSAAQRRPGCGARGSMLMVAQAAKGFGTPKPAAAPKPKEQTPPQQCACGSGKAYKNCCERYHNGSAAAPTAEATLRARFSAYHKGASDYLVSTTHPDYHVYHYQVAQPGGAEQRLLEDIASACNKFAFTGLKIVKVEPGTSDLEETVAFEFLSRKKMGPTGVPLSEAELVKDMSQWDRTAEKNRFLKIGNVWQFVDYQRFTFDAGMMSGVQAEVAQQEGTPAA